MFLKTTERNQSLIDLISLTYCFSIPLSSLLGSGLWCCGMSVSWLWSWVMSVSRLWSWVMSFSELWCCGMSVSELWCWGPSVSGLWQWRMSVSELWRWVMSVSRLWSWVMSFSELWCWGPSVSGLWQWRMSSYCKPFILFLLLLSSFRCDRTVNELVASSSAMPSNFPLRFLRILRIICIATHIKNNFSNRTMHPL